MFKFIFYALAGVAMLYELWKIQHFDTIVRLDNKMKEKRKSTEYTSEEHTLLSFMLLYYIWTFVGFFSNQWPLFIGILLLNCIKPMWKKLSLTRTYNIIDSVLTIIILLFIIINEYHLHISLI